MPAAIALYERLGYERAPQFDLDANAFYGIDDEPRVTALAYHLRLG